MKKVYRNSLWMMSEKILSIFGLIFVTSFVAQYIGPENFGKLTFAMSIFAVIQTFAMFGADNILFKKISQNITTGEHLIYATRIIRNVLYGSCASLVLAYLYFTADTLTFIFSTASCIALYFALHDVYSIYFNAILQSYINTLCNVTALVVSLLLRYGIAEFQLSPSYLSVPIILVTLIPFIMRRIVFQKRKHTQQRQVQHKLSYYRQYMLGVGKKLVLYSLSVAIFTKTSQFFLGLSSQHDLGIYTVAMTLGSSFYFVLTALISSFFTQIYAQKNLHQSQKMVAQLSSLVVVISLMAGIFFIVFGAWIVQWLYGSAYQQVNEILGVAVFVTLFSGLSTVAEKYLIQLNAYHYLHQKTLALVVFNILLTYFAVQFYGLKGAIYAILCTEFLSLTVFNYFYQRGIIFKTHLMMFSPKTYRNIKS